MPGCEVKPLVIPVYLDLINDASHRSSHAGMNFYEELSEHVRTRSAVKKNPSNYEKINLKAKSMPVALGGEYDCINEYEEIHVKEYEHILVSNKSQTADGGQRRADNTDIRPLPILYEPLRINSSQFNTKQKIFRRKGVIIGVSMIVLIVLVLVVVGAVANTLVVVKKNGDDNVVGKLYNIKTDYYFIHQTIK